MPALTQLLNTDYRTLVNCKKLLKEAEDKKKFDSTLDIEGRELIAAWMDENFATKMMGYFMDLMEQREKEKEMKKKMRAKL